MICKNICIKVIFIKDNTAIYYQIFPLSLCCWWVHFHLLDFSRMSNTVYWSYFDCDNWILTYVCLNPYSMQICIIYSSSWYFTDQHYRNVIFVTYCARVTWDFWLALSLQVDREFQVQKALYSVGFPVPQPLLLCADTQVIGTEFYVMEHVKAGFIASQAFLHSSTTQMCAGILYVGSIYLNIGIHDKKRCIFWIESLVWSGAYISGSASSWCERSGESCSLCCCSGSPGETTLTGPGLTEPQRIWKRIRLLQETGRWGCCTL